MNGNSGTHSGFLNCPLKTPTTPSSLYRAFRYASLNHPQASLKYLHRFYGNSLYLSHFEKILLVSVIKIGALLFQK